MTQEPQRVTVLVYGKVQGVFFRASTLEQAQRLRLTGWVQNLPDGGVEIVAEGPRPQLDELVAWAHHGPAAARVDDVKVSWRKATGEFDTFRVEH